MALSSPSDRNTPHRVTARDILLIVGVPFALLLLTHLLVAQRSVAGESRWLSLSPDTSEYVKLVQGVPASAPFAYRRLVPLLASFLPLAPVRALWLITQVSLLAGYSLLLWMLIAIVRVRRVAACLAVVAFMTSTRSLLLVQNPFLVDAFSFLMMTVMLAAFLADKALPFGLATVTGVLAREDCLFGAFGFLAARRRLAGLAIVLAAVAAYVLSRWRPPAHESAFLGFRVAMHASFYAKAFFACGFVWLLPVLGLWTVRTSDERRLLPYFACALGGSILSAFFAVDTTRVFLPVLPVATIAAALVFDRLSGNPVLLAAWLIVMIANLGLALPNSLFPGSGEHLKELEDWYVRLAVPIVAQQIAGVLLVIASARRILRRPIQPSPTSPSRS